MLGQDMVDVFARVNDCVARVGLLLIDVSPGSRLC